MMETENGSSYEHSTFALPEEHPEDSGLSSAIAVAQHFVVVAAAAVAVGIEIGQLQVGKPRLSSPVLSQRKTW
jgi:hypothetical protein